MLFLDGRIVILRNRISTKTQNSEIFRKRQDPPLGWYSEGWALGTEVMLDTKISIGHWILR